MKILVINSGSSSIKYKLFDMPSEHLIRKGVIEHIGEDGSPFRNHYSGLKIILEEIKLVEAVGHRVVHGAEDFNKPALVDSRVIKGIKKCCAIAPLHNPANLSGILACQKLLPGTKQVVVFDTAFHQSIPEYAFIYGLPYDYYQKLRVRKYGFHGTSHQYVALEASRILKVPLNKLKLITCHLGNGSSITAIDRGKSVDTSMGYTPLEGLVMGTRCGDVDPALITHIMHKKNLDTKQMDRILNKESGLKGISGISNDMRLLEEKAKQGNKRARLAMDIFVYRVRKYIGAYLAVLGGLNALIFTAGIGENQASVRENIYKGLFDCLKPKPKILVIPTNEELMIARQTYKLIKLSGGKQ
ncbi:MAG: acetate kinase [Candidatus Omnitrophica bacterium CG11_big_fil_rev_8_21_14_0_20_43_6]|nr:MAG: acetate kinase [Candidatus Omnitrophica bacterium CG11_big_fil_rev_8_21_14_0_20_43_6]